MLELVGFLMKKVLRKGQTYQPIGDTGRRKLAHKSHYDAPQYKRVELAGDLRFVVDPVSVQYYLEDEDDGSVT